MPTPFPPCDRVSDSHPRKLATAMRTMGQQQHSQRETCTGALQVKLDELQELNAKMEGLCSSAKELLESFGSEDTSFRTEFKSQLESLERFKDERMSIDAMRERLHVEQRKVEDFERRIERVQSKVERQKEKEAGKKRVSWRVRFLWGFLAMLVILWLLATAGSDGDYMLDNLTESQPIKLVSPSLKNGHDLEEFPLE
ncbi:hypothetical protein FN846DRAFT_783832 [Sphaerosporella brunnea]|uniref:Uncharacterized protein n=1 Tax=Sphaerosporella brunnea TaxID=1250544 RepID=A0A5J5EMK9_9PEZI|nr:hypothetical protein FN846DRAFT_783832 [Sphaerosporella brunnea]